MTTTKVRGKVVQSIEARFHSKYAVSVDTGCWLWHASRDGHGYGLFLARRAVGVGWHSRRAHRVSYELHVGPIPEGKVLDHLCRVRNCVNPQHLEAVTQRENVHRSEVSAATIHALQTHCVHGHAFDTANTRITSRGWRQCRACGRARHRRVA